MSSILFGDGNDVVHWKPSPNTRGTFDILTTCIITMLLCVWTAVHLNISAPGSFWEPKIRKVGWLILALLAPEIVAYTAWYQRQQARFIMQEVNKIYGLPNPLPWHDTMLRFIREGSTKLRSILMLPGQQFARQPTLESQKIHPAIDRHPWTIVHGFYAMMGGLAILVPSNLPRSEKFLPTDTDQMWFVTEYGIASWLTEKGPGRDEFPDLSKEEIKSKSKANGFAKTPVCFQALWFITQCITRLAQHIPIALLELNTFGHAVCALLIYFLWWEEPFEVDFPTIVHSKALWDACALRWMMKHKSPSFETFLREWQIEVKDHPSCPALSKYHKMYISSILRRQIESLPVESSFIDGFEAINKASTITEAGESGTEQTATLLERETGTSSTILAAGQNLVGTSFKLCNLYEQLEWINAHRDHFFQPQTSRRLKALEEISQTDPHSTKLILNTGDTLRWNMAWKAIQWSKRSRGQKEEAGTSTSERYANYVPFRSDLLLTERCGDGPAMDKVHIPSAIGFSIATLVYGGLHALAWHTHFHRPVEQILWRVSACGVIAGLPVIFLLHTAIEHLSEEFLEVLIAFVIIIVVIFYILARSYLVVECFINLAHLPAGIYDVPNWSAYLPHIT